MDVQQRHAGGLGLGVEAGVGQQRALHPRAAEAFDAVAAAADQQQRRRVGLAGTRQVQRQGLAVAAQQRVRVAVDVQPAGVGRGEECGARLGVALGEEGGGAGHALGVFSHFSASRTQAVAPSGIRSSLKS